MQIYIKYESFANISNIVANGWRYVELPGACPERSEGSSAGMVFCLLHGQGRSCPGTMNLLNDPGKKPWKHERRPAGLAMLREERSCPGREPC